MRTKNTPTNVKKISCNFLMKFDVSHETRRMIKVLISGSSVMLTGSLSKLYEFLKGSIHQPHNVAIFIIPTINRASLRKAQSFV